MKQAIENKPTLGPVVDTEGDGHTNSESGSLQPSFVQLRDIEDFQISWHTTDSCALDPQHAIDQVLQASLDVDKDAVSCLNKAEILRKRISLLESQNRELTETNNNNELLIKSLREESDFQREIWSRHA